MLRRVAAFCRPLWPVLLLVSFPRSRSPVVGVPGLCWMWWDVPFARQQRPVVGVLGLCWWPPQTIQRPGPGAYQEVVWAWPHRQVPQVVRLAAVAPGNGVLLRQIDVAQVPVHVLPRELEAEGGRALDALDAEGEDAFVRVPDFVAVGGLARKSGPKAEQCGPRWAREREGGGSTRLSKCPVGISGCTHSFEFQVVYVAVLGKSGTVVPLLTSAASAHWPSCVTQDFKAPFWHIFHKSRFHPNSTQTPGHAFS